MGTNYYVHTDRCPNGCEHCGASQTLHLGKSSIGWRFTFQAEPEWPREQAYNLWLERAKSGEIRDEYKQPITLDELLAFIDRKQDGLTRVGKRPDLPNALYTDMRDPDYTCNGYDFCDRPFT